MKTNFKTIMTLALFTNIALAAEMYNPNAVFYTLNKKEDGHIGISYNKPVDQYVKINSTDANNKYYTLKIGDSEEYVRVLEQADRTLVDRTFKEVDSNTKASTLKTASIEYDLSGNVKSLIVSENSIDNPEQEYTKVISPEICHELMVDDKLIEKMQACNGVNARMNTLTNKIAKFVTDTFENSNDKLNNLSKIKMPDEMSERSVLLEKSLSDCQFLVKNGSLAKVTSNETSKTATPTSSKSK